MKQASLNLNLNLNLNLSVKKTRKQVFLEQMDKVVPWAALVGLIIPYYPEGKTGRPPFSLETMLRIHFLQQWFTLSDPGMEEAFFDTLLLREFAQLEELGRLPDESTVLRFRHRLEKHKLAEQILETVNELLTQHGLLLKVGTAVDATLIAAPTSTKNKDRTRDPEMHSSKKGNLPTSVLMPSPAWCIPCAARLAMSVTSLRPTVCRTATRASPLAMRVTRALKDAPRQKQMSSGTSPCGQASAVR